MHTYMMPQNCHLRECNFCGSIGVSFYMLWYILMDVALRMKTQSICHFMYCIWSLVRIQSNTSLSPYFI